MSDNLNYSGNDEKKGKSGMQRAQDAKNTVDKGRNLLKAAKGISKLAPLVTAISTIGIILLIIFLAIGYIAFFETLPGLFVDKVKEIAAGFWGWFTGDEEVQIDAGQINDLAMYIEDLGYDIVGYGFERSSKVQTDSNGKFKGIDLSENLEDEKFKTSRSNLYAYVLASERTYTVRGVKVNHLKTIGKSLPLIHLAIVVADYLDNTNENGIMTNGMIYFDDLSLLEKEKIEVDIDRATEIMTVNTGVVLKDKMTYKLNNFTTKYGKPIELSLALHLSTMAPDFVYNFCMDNDLITTVHMGMEKMTIDTLKYKYQIPGFEPITKEEVYDAYNEIHSLFGQRFFEIFSKKRKWCFGRDIRN